MSEYKNFLIKNFKKRYRNSTEQSKNFLKYFFIHRENFIKLLSNKNKTYIQKNNLNDTTYNLLKKIYISNQKKYFYSLDQFIKKFEFNLKLKKKYTNKFKKLTNLETSIESYIFLALAINRSKHYNILQKTNLILKIVDKLYLDKSTLKRCDKALLLKLFKIEKNLVYKIINNDN